MDHDVRTTRERGVTLVAVRLRNTSDAPRRVRVRNALDGPVWPPRTNGVPDDGWTDAGYEGVLAANARRALGYATPAPPRSAVVAVTTEPAADTGEDALDPVRDLPDPRPPRDALPTPVPDAVTTWLDAVADRVAAGRATTEERRMLARAARLHARRERDRGDE